MRGTGSSALSFSGTESNIQGINNNGATPASNILKIMDYSATDKHKTAFLDRGDAANSVYVEAYRWADTSAITEIDIISVGANFDVNSRFDLYQIVSE